MWAAKANGPTPAHSVPVRSQLHHHASTVTNIFLCSRMGPHCSCLPRFRAHCLLTGIPAAACVAWALHVSWQQSAGQLAMKCAGVQAIVNMSATRTPVSMLPRAEKVGLGTLLQTPTLQGNHIFNGWRIAGWNGNTIQPYIRGPRSSQGWPLEI